MRQNETPLSQQTEEQPPEEQPHPVERLPILAAVDEVVAARDSLVDSRRRLNDARKRLNYAHLELARKTLWASEADEHPHEEDDPVSIVCGSWIITLNPCVLHDGEPVVPDRAVDVQKVRVL